MRVVEMFKLIFRKFAGIWVSFVIDLCSVSKQAWSFKWAKFSSTQLKLKQQKKIDTIFKRFPNLAKSICKQFQEISFIWAIIFKYGWFVWQLMIIVYLLSEHFHLQCNRCKN